MLAWHPSQPFDVMVRIPFDCTGESGRRVKRSQGATLSQPLIPSFIRFCIAEAVSAESYLYWTSAFGQTGESEEKARFAFELAPELWAKREETGPYVTSPSMIASPSEVTK